MGARRLALVTGGTKRLGAAIAARLAADGFDLALHSHGPESPLAALIAAATAAGAAWKVFPADLADGAELDALIPDVMAHFGRAPAVLVNSASRFAEDRWTDVTLASLTDHFAINAAAPAKLAQAFAAALGDAGRGCVVNILDQRIVSPPDDQAGYTVSKLALAGITQALARALAPRVRVNAVAPGLTIPTPDFSVMQLDRLAALMPLGQLPTPAQVADAVAFLIQAEATSGQVIFVDGGASLRSYDRDFVALGRES